MNPYYPFLYLVFTHQPSTRFHLEKNENGKYKGVIDEYISKKNISRYDAEITTQQQTGDGMTPLKKSPIVVIQ